MTSRAGHLFKIAWGNPYTNPPGGKPRCLAEMFVLSDGHGARVPDEFKSLATQIAPPGCGYSICISSLSEPIKSRTPEQRASLRQKKLGRRITGKYPMFADQFIEQAIAAKPDYYLQGTSLEDADREACLAEYAARFEFLVAHAGQILRYDI